MASNSFDNGHCNSIHWPMIATIRLVESALEAKPEVGLDNKSKGAARLNLCGDAIRCKAERKGAG